ncbi:hypothetical protein ACJIZ3_006211 [Penstemon smallii]|uniref:Uncharacterized protein n=1 Tax=Penstemon smallii TaxID=265156 RepID=A0ABD3S778_9LAMI
MSQFDASEIGPRLKAALELHPRDCKMEDFEVAAGYSDHEESKPKPTSRESIDFTKLPIDKLPTAILIGHGVAKLGDLWFRVLDSAGLEAETSSGSVLGRTAAMTGEVLGKAQFVLFLVDARLLFLDVFIILVLTQTSCLF